MFAVLGVLKFTIEPADYKKCVVSDLKTANQLLKNAKSGNENGQYSDLVLLSFKKSVKDAQALVDDQFSTVDEEKSEYKSLKAATDIFKASANKDSVSKETVSQLKSEGKSIEKNVKLDKTSAVHWKIDGKAVKEPAAVNPDVSYNTVNKDAVEQILKANQMKGTIFSFRHNGNLPGLSSISVDYPGHSTDLYLYRYDSGSNTLVFSVKVIIDQGKELFSIDQGGDWVIADKQLAIATASPVGNSQISSQGSAVSSQVSNLEASSGGKTPAKSPSNSGGNTGPAGNSTSGNSGGNSDGGSGSTEPAGQYCTLEIRCDTILHNMDKLKSGLALYVPSDGTILAKTQIKIVNGESVFDILKRVTRNLKIQMEFRNDPLYSGAYIEGIHQLYEHDCDTPDCTTSGWMYKVNGWFPSYGCSQYKVKNGDAIEWVYTCNCGKDVGDQYYNSH